MKGNFNIGQILNVLRFQDWFESSLSPNRHRGRWRYHNSQCQHQYSRAHTHMHARTISRDHKSVNTIDWNCRLPPTSTLLSVSVCVCVCVCLSVYMSVQVYECLVFPLVSWTYSGFYALTKFSLNLHLNAINSELIATKTTTSHPPLLGTLVHLVFNFLPPCGKSILILGVFLLFCFASNFLVKLSSSAIMILIDFCLKLVL